MTVFRGSADDGSSTQKPAILAFIELHAVDLDNSVDDLASFRIERIKADLSRVLREVVQHFHDETVGILLKLHHHVFRGHEIIDIPK